VLRPSQRNGRGSRGRIWAQQQRLQLGTQLPATDAAVVEAPLGLRDLQERFQREVGVELGGGTVFGEGGELDLRLNSSRRVAVWREWFEQGRPSVAG
jgi:hypothetical protein